MTAIKNTIAATEFSQEELNPFAAENLRLSQAFAEQMPVKKLLTVVPVRKPAAQEWIRVHPDPEFHQNVAMIELREDREFFIVTRELVPELITECKSYTLYLAINRQGVAFLWPVRLPDPDGKDLAWWQSAREAADRAAKSWTRLQANMSLGAYDIWEPQSDLGEPEWPEPGFWDLVKIAFKKNLIGTLDHPVVKRLRGLP
jgi:hypothetical protein